MQGRRVKVLLVEDDEDDYIIVRDLLSEIERWQHELAWVATYEEALKAMESNGYDVYLIDYRLGARDGLELLRQGRKKGCKGPFLLLTGQGNYEVDIEAMQAGAADYLVKGAIDAAMLERSIRYAIERAQMLEKLSRQAAELAKANTLLEEKERLLAAFHQIGQATLSSLELDEVLDNLTTQIVEAGVFHDIAIALVDAPGNTIQVVRNSTCRKKRRGKGSGREPGHRCRLDEDHPLAEVVHTGRLQLIQGENGRLAPLAEAAQNCRGRVSYLIPVKQEERVLAILITSSGRSEREEMLRRIEVMHPFLDQVAIALDHAETTRKLNEARLHLIQADKMASLGQLVAGIAHEINNPVGFVTSSIQSLTEYVEIFKGMLQEYEALFDALQIGDTARGQKALKRIEEVRAAEDLSFLLTDLAQLLADSKEGMERIAGIVQGLKNFARVDGDELQEADLNGGIEAALKITANELKYKCQIHKKLSPLPPTYCYLGQLNQVFMNLLVNAAQAIPEWGDLTIETEATDSHIVVRIADTGGGIPEAIRHRIFEPFFTTKPVGQGTGLGLAISYSIIQAHKGSIEVRSEEGKGTEFTIRIPRDLEKQLSSKEDMVVSLP